MKNWFQHLKDTSWGSLSIAICSGVILYVILENLGNIFKGIGTALSWFSPVFGGLVIAYVLNFFVVFLQKHLYAGMKNQKKAYTCSVITAVLIAVIAIVILTAILIPQLVKSFSDLITNWSSYVNSLSRTLQSLTAAANKNNANVQIDLAPYVTRIADQIQKYLTENSTNILNSVAATGSNAFNWIISFFIAIYVLMAKQSLLKGMRIIARKIFKEPHYASVSSQYHRINAIFSRYIICEIIDALIVGGSNALFMAIAGMPYIALVSVTVGITNLAPTFGPIVGAVIGSFILLLAKPTAVIPFLIFTIILQTVDGYLIKPKMYGSALSVPSVFILIAIVVLGRMFGVIGILLAIPIAAIITYLVRDRMKESAVA